MRLINIRINKKWFTRDFHRIAIKKLPTGTEREVDCLALEENKNSRAQSPGRTFEETAGVLQWES